MKRITRLAVSLLLVELLLALGAYQLQAVSPPRWTPDPPPRYAVPPPDTRMERCDTIQGTVSFPKQLRYIHRVVNGWVYGPANHAALFHPGDAIAFLTPEEDQFVRRRAAQGQSWTSLHELGY